MNKTEQPEYRVFMSAKNRCNNPKNPDYRNYGGRGIRLLFQSYHEIIEDIGERPTKKHSIDRIDNNGDYMKGNIRWVTRLIQNNNKRKGFDGKEMLILALRMKYNAVRVSEILEISDYSVYAYLKSIGLRYPYHGSSHPFLITSEKDQKYIYFLHKECGITQVKLSQIFKVSPNTILKYCNRQRAEI